MPHGAVSPDGDFSPLIWKKGSCTKNSPFSNSNIISSGKDHFCRLFTIVICIYFLQPFRKIFVACHLPQTATSSSICLTVQKNKQLPREISRKVNSEARINYSVSSLK